MLCYYYDWKTSPIGCSGSKFYGTLQNELKYLFVSCVVFSFIDTHSYLSKPFLSVLDENESAEIVSIIEKEWMFPQGHIEKVKRHLRICLSSMTAKQIDQWKKGILSTFCVCVTSHLFLFHIFNYRILH